MLYNKAVFAAFAILNGVQADDPVDPAGKHSASQSLGARAKAVPKIVLEAFKDAQSFWTGYKAPQCVENTWTCTSGYSLITLKPDKDITQENINCKEDAKPAKATVTCKSDSGLVTRVTGLAKTKGKEMWESKGLIGKALLIVGVVATLVFGVFVVHEMHTSDDNEHAKWSVARFMKIAKNHPKLLKRMLVMLA